MDLFSAVIYYCSLICFLFTAGCVTVVFVPAYRYLQTMLQYHSENEDNDSYIFNERMNRLECRIEKINQRIKLNSSVNEEYVSRPEFDRILFTLRDEIKILEKDLKIFKQNQLSYDNEMEATINLLSLSSQNKDFEKVD
jgi:hypothetical protein